MYKFILKNRLSSTHWDAVNQLIDILNELKKRGYEVIEEGGELKIVKKV